MIFNAIDEVLFWEDIDVLKEFDKENWKKFYPHDFKGWCKVSKAFFRSIIPDKAEFTRRLKKYEENGKPVWIAGRNNSIDDIDTDQMIKAISVSSKIANGEQKAAKALGIQEKRLSFLNIYADNIFHMPSNHILELTIGAGGGTNLVMKRMTENDYYMGVDIDFICAKNADALAKYYNVNGLGVATSLWNLPFEDSMFTSVCCAKGLNECREIPTILKEAYRVLKPGGKFVVECIHDIRNTQSYGAFSGYGFSEEEVVSWLKKLRMYAGSENTEEILTACGFKFCKRIIDENCGDILVFEK